MIPCPECAATHYPGTLFCDECGAYLGDLQGVATRPRPDSAANVVHVKLLDSGREIRLDLATPIWIGRADPQMNFHPRLDLSQDGGVDFGVSRRHARIANMHANVVIIDQNSANGTWLNDQRLTPERPYTLPREATLRLGRFHLEFTLE